MEKKEITEDMCFTRAYMESVESNIQQGVARQHLRLKQDWKYFHKYDRRQGGFAFTTIRRFQDAMSTNSSHYNDQLHQACGTVLQTSAQNLFHFQSSKNENGNSKLELSYWNENMKKIDGDINLLSYHYDHFLDPQIILLVDAFALGEI